MRLSVAEWAKSIGISEPTARQRIKNHGIPVVNHTVDPEEANAIWEASRNPKQQRRQAGRDTEGESAQSPLAKVQYEREVIKRETELVALRKIKGELVDAAEVESEFAEKIGLAKTRILGVPNQVALQVAETKDAAKCAAIITNALKNALSGLAESNG